MSLTREKPDFMETSPQNRDRQTLAHLCLTNQDRRDRARLRQMRRAAGIFHKCAVEISTTAEACPVCGTVIKTLDDFTGGS